MLNALIYTEDDRNTDFYQEVIRAGSPDAEIQISRKPRDALGITLEKQVELVIADIQATRGKNTDFSGLRFLDCFRSNPNNRYVFLVIVSDLYDEKLHFYQQLKCFDYFQKPLNRPWFHEKVSDLSRYLDKQHQKLYRDIEQLHYFRYGQSFYPVREKDLVRFELHTRDGLVVTMEEEIKVDVTQVRKNLELLQSENILQCSRSDYVNTGFIRQVDRDKVKLDKEKGEIILSPSGKKNIMRWLNQRMGKDRNGT